MLSMVSLLRLRVAELHYWSTTRRSPPRMERLPSPHIFGRGER
jgi:hypothetical protein